MALLFFLYPFAEIYLWVLFIQAYSFLDALLFVITSGVLGFVIMNMQGKATVMTIQASLVEGKVPAKALLHRGAIMMGGVLLMIPGILSKLIGGCLVLPVTRHLLVWWIKFYITAKVASGAFKVFTARAGSFNVGGFRESPGGTRDVVDITPQISERRETFGSGGNAGEDK